MDPCTLSLYMMEYIDAVNLVLNRLSSIGGWGPVFFSSIKLMRGWVGAGIPSISWNCEMLSIRNMSFIAILCSVQSYQFTAYFGQFFRGIHVVGMWIGRLHGPASLAAFFVSVQHAVLAEILTRIMGGVI